MKENYEEKPITELCYGRYAGWDNEMKLRSSTSGAAQYLATGHVFPDVKRLRRESEAQSKRIQDAEEMITEITRAQQEIDRNPVDSTESRVAKIVKTYNEDMFGTLIWKENVVEYGNERTYQQRVIEAEKYIAKGDIALGVLLGHIKLTIDHNLERIVEQAIMDNMEDKSVQIRVALERIKAVMKGDSVLVREKMRANLSNIRPITKMKDIPQLLDKISEVNNKHFQSMNMFGGESTIRQSDLKRQLSECIKESENKDVAFINIRIKGMSKESTWEEVKAAVKEEMVSAAVGRNDGGSDSDNSGGSGKRNGNSGMVALNAKMGSMEKRLNLMSGGSYSRGRGNGGRAPGGRGNGGRGGRDGQRGGRGDGQRGGRGDGSGSRGGGRAYMGNGVGECFQWVDNKGECSFGDQCKFKHSIGKEKAGGIKPDDVREDRSRKREEGGRKAYAANEESDASTDSAPTRGGSPYPKRSKK